MLKHTSSKLELRGGGSGDTQSDLDNSRDDLLLNISSNTLDSSFHGRTKSSERLFTDIIPKPTIQKIIERRKSDFALKDQKPPAPLITSEELPTIESEEHKERAYSKDSIHSTKEVIEEVQLDNSTYLIHKRKKADPKQKRNLSDTSTESGIASQLSGSTNNKPNDDDAEDDEQELIANVDANSDLVENNKQYWESEEEKPIPPIPPIAITSPPPSSRYTDRNNNSVPRAPSTANSYASLEIKEIFRRQEQERVFEFDSQSQRSRYSERPPRHLQQQRQYHTLGRQQPRLYVDAKTRQYLQPRSAQTDIYLDNRRYAGSVVGSRSLQSLNMKGRHPQYAQSCCTLPTRGANGHLKRKETFHSISAGSSVSNIPPNYSSAARSVCSCGTLGPGLSEIKEDMPVFHEAFPQHSITANQNHLSKAKYVAIFFIIVAAICCIIGGFLHFYVGYFPEDFDMNQGDIKLLRFSSTFCRGVKGSSDQGQIRLIAFETNSDSPMTRRLKYSRSKEQFKVNPKQIWKRDFYLLESSKIEITIETDSLIDVLVFKGENSMSIWESRKESESYIFFDSCCSNKFPRRGIFEFTASSTDQYYVVLHNRIEIIPVAIKLFRMEIDRLSYDFSETVASCKTLNGGDCTVEYPLTGSKVAVEVPLVKNSNEISSSLTLRYMCVPREWMYCVFFMAMFVICVLFIAVVYYMVIKICIPSKRCCCYRNDLKKKNGEIVYYDNHGRTTSELYLDQHFDSVSHARSYAPSTRRSEVKSLYNDTASRSSRYPPSRHTSRVSGVSRHAYDNMGHTGSVATLYKDDYVDFETADSGISMIPEQLSPSGISSVTAQEAYNQKHKDARRHKQMQQRAFDLINGPPVKNLLHDRPRSVAGDHQRPNDHRRYLSQPDPHVEYDLDEFDQLPDHYLKPHSDQVPPVRRHSERVPSSDPYNNQCMFSENAINNNDERTKNIDYDDREIFI